MEKIGFGTYRIRDQTIIEKAIECGYNHFDTAELYQNERLVYNAINKYTNSGRNFWITTKISKKSILNDKIEESLNERLQIFPYINLLLLHIPSSDCRKDWEILSNLYKKNRDRIGYIGVSNYDIEHLEQIKNCEIKPYCNQIELSIFYTRDLLVTYMKEKDIHIVSHTTLTRAEKFDNKTIIDIANKYDMSIAQLMLKWAIDNEYIVIPKSSTVEHMLENMEYKDTEIRDEDSKILSELNENFFITKVHF